MVLFALLSASGRVEAGAGADPTHRIFSFYAFVRGWGYAVWLYLRGHTQLFLSDF